MTDIGFLVRVTRTSGSEWKIFTSTLPTANGGGAIATDVPSASNTSVNQGNVTDSTYTTFDNGYFGFMAVHSSAANPQTGAEFDQLYFDTDSDSSLPVELSRFTATSVEKGTKLKWRTESEINNVGFGIYRSTQEDGRYRRIAWVDGQGSTPVAHDYQFLDRKAKEGETYYYFLEDVDLEGNTERSEIITVTFQRPVVPLDVIPTQFALYQNYPNPFNPETWIPYDLASPATVVMTIYDARGQVVRTFSLQRQEAGGYRSREAAIYWDGQNQRGETVSSGVHFYHFSAGEYHETRKMLILK